MSVFVEVAVGDGPDQVSLADADALASAARTAGATGIRLVDPVGSLRTIDPSVVGAYLAGRHGTLAYLIDAATTHNAPYNLARRLLSFDRATDGRAGLVLRPGAGDEVSESFVPDADAADPAARWAEYADVLVELWRSFPADALIGDQDNAVVADDLLIHPIDHVGRFYRVAGPLDGPSSVQGGPPIVAADPIAVGWDRVAHIADAVIVDEIDATGADAALSEALRVAGRGRRDVALLLRVTRVDSVADLAAQLADTGVDGVVLALGARAVTDVVDAIGVALAHVPTPVGGTLRASLGLRGSVEVPA